MDQVRIPITLLDAELDMPHYAYPGDAGIDIRSAIDITLLPFERALVPTGIALAIPQGYAGLVLPRSGRAIKEGLSLVNAPGLIDSNYRGEIKAVIINLDAHDDLVIKRNERIAQFMAIKIPFIEFVEQEELEQSQRGSGGFGSSGV